MNERPGRGRFLRRLIALLCGLLFTCQSVLLILLTVLGPAPKTSKLLAWLPAWAQPTSHSVLFPIIMLGAGWVMITWSRRPSPVPNGALIGYFFVLTVVLGVAGFWNTATVDGHIHWILLITWVLGLFFGANPDVPGLRLLEPATNQDWLVAGLSVQLAQFTGMMTVSVAAVKITMSLLQVQLHRFWSWLALDIDVIVGIENNSLELAQALLTERGEWPISPRWHRVWPHEHAWNWVVKRFLSGVLVIHSNAADPRLGEFRAIGCKVLIAPLSDETLRRLLLTQFDYPKVRRLFAVGRPADNLKLLRRVRDIFDDQTAGDRSTRLRSFTPRLVALVNDPREAHAWRLVNLDSTRCFLDAISFDETLARDIVRCIIDKKASTVVLLGDSALTVAILDQITLSRAFDDEEQTIIAEKGGPRVAFPIACVHIIDSHASAQLTEWRQHQTPAATRPSPLPIHGHDDSDWDAACEKLLGVSNVGATGLPIASAIVVTGPPSSQLTAKALRLSGRHENAMVFCPDSNTAGVESQLAGTSSESAGDLLPGRWVISYGPSLLQDGLVPEDSWTILARQQHSTFCLANGSNGTAARYEWLDARYPEADTRPNRSRQPPSSPDKKRAQQRLPQFYREDTLSQQRRIMRAVCDLGYQWAPVPQNTAYHPLSLDELDQIAQKEHERWCEARLHAGWGPALHSTEQLFQHLTDEERTEALERHQEWDRRNRNLWVWETGAAWPRRRFRIRPEAAPKAGHTVPTGENASPDAIDPQSTSAIPELQSGGATVVSRRRWYTKFSDRLHSFWREITRREDVIHCREKDLEQGQKYDINQVKAVLKRLHTFGIMPQRPHS